MIYFSLLAVYNDRNATYEELLEKGRLSSLENRRLQDILILMYKVKNSLAPDHVCNMFFQKDKYYNLQMSVVSSNFGHLSLSVKLLTFCQL